MKRLVTVLAVAGLALVGCGSSGGRPASSGPAGASSGAAGGGQAVAIKGYAFAPGDLTIAAGSSVTWTMDDDGTVHDVVDQTHGIHSPDLQKGGTFTYTFRTPGTYSYLCDYHPYMKGTITVR